jgi:hypothetical protein
MDAEAGFDGNERLQAAAAGTDRPALTIVHF